MVFNLAPCYTPYARRFHVVPVCFCYFNQHYILAPWKHNNNVNLGRCRAAQMQISSSMSFLPLLYGRAALRAELLARVLDARPT